ncbi:MAG: GNAT family N-acetyltransferase [Acidobacteriia bacterium]|nr:GNAT family N-acetyltransferase [Terriglobia bacterium]
MNNLPESLFANPVWHALHTKHRHFAASVGGASRYPADVAPFAAVSAPSAVALQHLHSLLTPGESVWLIGEGYPSVPELSCDEILECFQMVLPAEITPPRPAIEVLRLSDADAPEMVALTTLAFPGFFRKRTCEMGSYYGVRSGGQLIAMGGERLVLDGYPEISGVCTHPVHRGQGLATSLIWQLAHDHRRAGLVSWLHVGCANHSAIELYLQMGFKVAHKVKLHRLCRKD